MHKVFEALDMDVKDVAEKKRRVDDAPYSQEIPEEYGRSRTSGPPILPPHLLQVILNKDTPLSCEPTLLPMPNHVMLNHMYALQIKVRRVRDKRVVSTQNFTFPGTCHGHECDSKVQAQVCDDCLVQNNSRRMNE